MMTQVSSHETKWNQLVSLAGEHDTTLNAALTAALTGYQTRHGCLPGGFDSEEWEDVYAAALAGYKTLAANSLLVA